MRLFKPTTMAIFGLGFLAGSRSGRGPWNAVENRISQLQNRSSAGGGGLYDNGVRTVPNSNQGAVSTSGTDLR
jgi:hypothetical protein